MFRLPTILAGITLTAFSCSAAEPPTPALDNPADRLNRLGLSLLSAARGPGAGNVAVSPWPTYRSLSLAYLGAKGETKTEIAKALLTEDPAADAYALREQIASVVNSWNRLAKTAREPGDRVPTMEWSDLSTVWISHRAGGKAAYLEAIKKVPGAMVRAIDFNNPGKAQVDINEGIAEATQGKIPRLLPTGAVTKDTRFILASAVHLRAPWQSQFDPKSTRFELFHIIGAAPERVPTMMVSRAFPSAVYDDFLVLALPVASVEKSGFQLLIFLPNEAKDLASIEKQITPDLLRDCLKMRQTELQVQLPRFRVAPTSLGLKEPLRAIGMRAAFEPGVADFSAMASAPLFIDGIFDACEFSIDENGISGAAVMAVTATLFRGSPPPAQKNSLIRVDRPFAFALQHTESGACLFLGRVLDPR